MDFDPNPRFMKALTRGQYNLSLKANFKIAQGCIQIISKIIVPKPGRPGGLKFNLATLYQKVVTPKQII